MKISVMTLGCPAWDLDTLLARIHEYGYDGVDFRGVGPDLDITKTAAFTTDIAQTKRKIANSGLEVSAISSSLTICDPEKRQANIEEAKRTVPVAMELGVKNIRIFGNGPVDKIGKKAAAQIGRDCFVEMMAIPGADKLSWNFETHDHWSSAADCNLLIDEVNHPAIGMLWDLGNSLQHPVEPPEATIKGAGHRIKYTHIKDLKFDKAHPLADKDGWRYLIPGEGQLPLANVVKLLDKSGYNGWYVFEHEKRWIPNLPDPEVAFPAFVKWFRALPK